MLRSNLFFKYKENNRKEIVSYNSNKKNDLQDQIYIKIIDIDKKILENSNALIQAQIVNIRTAFSKSNNLIEKIGRNVYKDKLKDSITWHQKELKELYLRRRELQFNLEKIKGIFWLNRIKRFLKTSLIIFFILLSLLIILSGFMMMIYILPLVLLMVLIYSLFSKKY